MKQRFYDLFNDICSKITSHSLGHLTRLNIQGPFVSHPVLQILTHPLDRTSQLAQSHQSSSTAKSQHVSSCYQLASPLHSFYLSGAGKWRTASCLRAQCWCVSLQWLRCGSSCCQSHLWLKRGKKKSDVYVARKSPAVRPNPGHTK